MTTHRGAGRPLVGRDDGQLRHPAGRAGPRRRRARLGRRRHASTSTCSAASRSTSSATPTRRSSRRSPRRSRTPRATSPTSPCTSRACALAERLLDLAGAAGRVFFCNSGAEANEAAFKIGRRTGAAAEVVAADGGFHGRTMGALALTGQPAKRDPFEPLPGDGRLRPLRRRRRAAAPPSTRGTAAVILEPILGEGGVVAGAGRLPRRGPRDRPTTPARCWSSTRCRPASAAPGTGSRTRPTGVRPGRHHPGQGARRRPADRRLLGVRRGGRPARARARTARTFGGNPVSCAAALAVLDTIERRGPARPRQARRRAPRRRRRGARPPAASATSAAAGCCWASSLTADVAARASRRACARPGFLVNAVAAGRRSGSRRR